MRLASHKKYSAVVKGIVAVAYIILLGAQLSHKFYLCANSPIGAFKDFHYRVANRQPPGSGITTLLNHKKLSRLSLDKRYHLKHVFAIIDPVDCFGSYIPPQKQKISCCYPVPIRSYSGIHPLRGPPFA